MRTFMYFLEDCWPVILFVAALLFFGNMYSKHVCNNYTEITGKNTKYASFDACYIETDKGYQRWDEYKARSIASEGLAD